MVFDFFGQRRKVVIAMAHIGALPGTPLYDAAGGIAKLIDGVARDVAKLQAGGVHAIMFGNENDRPYQFKAPAEGIAAMTAVIAAIKPSLKVPFGVNYLWDPTATVAIAAATGASFAREIFTGLFASDMGLWQPERRRGAAPAPQSRARRSQAPLQYQRGIRRVARHAADRTARQERGVLLAGRCHSGLRSTHRTVGRDLRSQESARGGSRSACARQHRCPHR